jgi:SWI/SNF-related matrix-associated actin-dependent regulator 1 of chromatin subfamily A
MVKLYPHQEIAKRFILEKKYCLIGDDMGLGKTLEAIAALICVQGVKVIVAPAHLRNTWRVELKKWYPDEVVELVSSSKHTYGKAGWYILSYAMLKHCEVIPKAIVFDECHYIKNLQASRTKEAHIAVAGSKPEYCVALSGTPIKNSASEFYSILRLLSLCPSQTNGLKITEKSQYAFNLRFSYPRTQTVYTPSGPLEVTKFEGIRNLDRLKSYLRGKYLRRLTKNVIDLPEIIDKEILISVKKDKELLKAFTDFEQGAKDEHIMSMKASNAAMKTKATIEYVTDLVVEHKEPVIVFTDHVHPCKAIAEGLEARKIKVDIIHGSIPTAKRSYTVDRFQSGSLDVIVCTIGAASTGFTLTRARNMVFNDYSWSYVDMAQARKRIHRIGQGNSCVVHYILISDADQFIRSKVMEKERILNKAL